MRITLLAFVACICLRPLSAGTPLFKEVLQFGGEGDDLTYLWTGSVYVAANAQGDIYVADSGDLNVYRFDPQGKFKALVAKKGEGPGEIQSLASIQILQDGTLVLFDGMTGSLKYFDAANQYLKEVRIASAQFRPVTMLLSPAGNQAYSIFNQTGADKSVLTEKRGLIQLPNTLVKELSATSIQRPVGDKNQEFWIAFFKNIIHLAMADQAVFAFGSQDTTYVGAKFSHQITQTDSSGKQTTFGVQHPRRMKPQEEIDGYLTDLINTYKAGYPPEFTPFFTQNTIQKAYQAAKPNIAQPDLVGLIAMQHGYLLSLFEDDRTKKVQRADIYDAKGTHLGEKSFDRYQLMGEDDLLRMVFANNKAYTVLTDENEGHRIAVYDVQYPKGGGN